LLRQLANAFTGRTSIPVSVNIAGDHVLSADIQVPLYRICQEALNNIAKYSRASLVEIDLQYDTDAADNTGKGKEEWPTSYAGALQRFVVSSVELRIRDDGLGFDPSELARPGHYGLGMMRERAEAVGAQLTVTSNPGHGTEVTVCWPGNTKQEAL
jgi:signal transduction histidine kinase